MDRSAKKMDGSAHLGSHQVAELLVEVEDAIVSRVRFAVQLVGELHRERLCGRDPDLIHVYGSLLQFRTPVWDAMPFTTPVNRTRRVFVLRTDTIVSRVRLAVQLVRKLHRECLCRRDPDLLRVYCSLLRVYCSLLQDRRDAMRFTAGA